MNNRHNMLIPLVILAMALCLSIPALAKDKLDVVYFAMQDRFANGDPTNDTGGIAGDSSRHGLDPTREHFYHGGDLAGLNPKT